MFLTKWLGTLSWWYRWVFERGSVIVYLWKSPQLLHFISGCSADLTNSVYSEASVIWFCRLWFPFLTSQLVNRKTKNIMEILWEVCTGWRDGDNRGQEISRWWYASIALAAFACPEAPSNDSYFGIEVSLALESCHLLVGNDRSKEVDLIPRPK